jgi:hypothetical protein
MRTERSKKLFDEFLLKLKTVSEQKGYAFNFEQPITIKKLQLYDFHANNKTYSLFIHVSLDQGLWGLPSFYQEVIQYLAQIMEKHRKERHLPQIKEDRDWAVVLLQEPRGENYPLGYLLPSNDFLRMKSSLSIDRKGWLKIEEKHLSLKYQFYNWDTFFQLLNL